MSNEVKIEEFYTKEVREAFGSFTERLVKLAEMEKKMFNKPIIGGKSYKFPEKEGCDG